MATRCIKNDSESLNIREMQIQTRIKYHLIPGSSNGEESTCNAVDLVQSLGWEDSLEKGMATFSSILAWRIPWTEEPDRLQSMGSQSQT